MNEPYEKYRNSILLLIKNVPPERYGNHGGNSNYVKYATWHEVDLQSNTDNLETALVKNSSVELKIYNKSKQLEDLGVEEVYDKSVMRVEYTIKDRRILDTAFGDHLVTSLTDASIEKLFSKYFERDIVTPFYNWKRMNHSQLVEVTQKHKKQYGKWVEPFLRDCRKYEQTHALPILFDLEDMKNVFQELEPKSGRNAMKKYLRFKDRAIYEDDLIGNTRRTEEIIDKVLRLC